MILEEYMERLKRLQGIAGSEKLSMIQTAATEKLRASIARQKKDNAVTMSLPKLIKKNAFGGAKQNSKTGRALPAGYKQLKEAPVPVSETAPAASQPGAKELDDYQKDIIKGIQQLQREALGL